MKSSDFELLLPVGQKEMAEAAIQNGADAIYVGFPGFNARGRSYDFELEELKHIIERCHLNGVKVNLAFNIVIFENELPLVVEALEKVLPLKPDALIVQDLGLVRIVKEMCPEQVVHASTQMTVTNDLAIQFLENLDIKRFVLGRENSISEIKLIAERTKKELEVFVHGALCVSYSGQCFTSETLGGRSANRGQCAQSCRFSYDLIVDGETRHLLDRTYLVSPKDLCGIADVPELMRLGVKSFKVEGRLKTPEYVAQVAKSYRSIIERTVQNQAVSENQLQIEKNKMAVAYSRGFFPGWLHGVNHQELVNGTFSSHRGLEIGTISAISKKAMEIELSQKNLGIENGDGLLWMDGKEKTGGSIYSYSAELDGKILKVEFSNAVQLKPEWVGSLVYLNHDRSQKKEIEKALTDKNHLKRIPVQIELKLELGKPFVARVSDSRFTLEMQTEGLLSAAQNKPLTEAMLFDEFSSLSATVFKLEKTHFKTNLSSLASSTGLFLSHKEIKILRQNIFAKLARLRQENKIDIPNKISREINCESNQSFKDSIKLNEIQLNPFQRKSSDKKMGLNILLRNKEQVQDLAAALQAGKLFSEQILTVCLDFEFGRDYQVSVEKLKALNLKTGLATTRILKPQEYINLKIIHSLNPDFILVRNLGALYYFKNVQKFKGLLKGDFSLNVTNHRTFEYLLESGLDTVCLSYDLNFDQTISLLNHIDAGRAEITIHQSMPSFHMEHCVFAAFLSQGRSYKDCGKPCEKHKVQLKDQFGHYHWIKPDQECRNTMYNASAQTALPYLNQWKQAGLGEIRFEALHESGDELIQKISHYIAVLENKKSIDAALSDLKLTERYGLSARQLDRAEEYQARKKDHRFL